MTLEIYVTFVIVSFSLFSLKTVNRIVKHTQFFFHLLQLIVQKSKTKKQNDENLMIELKMSAVSCALYEVKKNGLVQYN